MKRLIKSTLFGCGLDVRRVRSPRAEDGFWKGRSREQAIKIGEKIIYTDCLPLVEWYKAYPEVNRVSTRLTSVIGHFYSDFQAVDIGANCGDTIARLFDGWSGRVLAIEPDANCQKWLRTNWGDDTRVTIKPVWLSSTSSVAKATLSKTGWNTTLDPTTGGNTQIDFKTLDEVISLEPEFTNVKLIKVDAEGFDGQILMGSRQTLLRHKPAVLFESNMDTPAMKGTDPMGVFAFLIGLGYESFFLYDDYGRFVVTVDNKQLDFLRDLLDYADGKFGRIHYYDAIAIHNADAALRDHFMQSERQYRNSL